MFFMLHELVLSTGLIMCIVQIKEIDSNAVYGGQFTLLYIEVTISFLIGRKRIVNFRGQRL